MDFTVLDSTQGCSSLYACHEKQRGGQDGGRENQQRTDGSQGRGPEPDMIRLSLIEIDQKLRIFFKSSKFTFQKLTTPAEPLPLPGASVKPGDKQKAPILHTLTTKAALLFSFFNTQD